ncbi:MAG: hypothetical protein EOO40_08280 [Deltaproteobacteria bacterium]|nr:MAG: hypothetical protein EOO40_08280 [Deltaproteobacteria bacterium]
MNNSGLDNGLYPTLTAYLNALPQGLDSYPEVKTRADYTLLLRPRLKAALEVPTLGTLRPHLTADYKSGEWVPETVYAALCALAQDRVWPSEEAYHQGMSEVAAAMYQAPLYRAVMLLLSPSLIAMGAAHRWHTFHQGSDLKVTKQGKQSADLTLSFPDKVFSKPALRSLGAVFCAALTGAGATETRFRITLAKPGEAQFAINWGAAQ